MLQKRFSVVLVILVAMMALASGCGKKENNTVGGENLVDTQGESLTDTQGDASTDVQGETSGDIKEDNLPEENVSHRMECDKFVYEIIDNKSMVRVGSDGAKEAVAEFEEGVAFVKFNNRKCFVLVNTETEGNYKLYSVCDGTTDIVEELSLPVSSFELYEDGTIFAKDMSGRCYYNNMYTMETVSDVKLMPEHVWNNVPKVESIDIMPDTLCGIGDVVYYAHCNEIHRMNQDGTDDQVIFTAPDIIYDMDAKQDYLFFAMTNATWRLHVPSGDCYKIAEHYNMPVKLTAIDGNHVELQRMKHFNDHDTKTKSYELPQEIYTNATELQGIACSYVYEDNTYIMWRDTNGCMMLGRRDQNDKVEILTSGESMLSMIKMEDETENGRFSWDSHSYKMEGNNEYCYIKSPSGQIFYVDYLNKEIRPLLMEIQAVDMKVCDANRILIWTKDNSITCMEYDPLKDSLVENMAMAKTLPNDFNMPVCIGEDKHNTYETANYIPAYAERKTEDKIYYADCNQVHVMNHDYSDDQVVFIADEVVRVIYRETEQTASYDNYLYFITTNHVYRYSMKSGECEKLDVQLPDAAFDYWVDENEVFQYQPLTLYRASYWEGFIYEAAD